MEVLAETETIHVKKSTYDCYEDNSMKMTHCINEIINILGSFNVVWMIWLKLNAVLIEYVQVLFSSQNLKQRNL